MTQSAAGSTPASPRLDPSALRIVLFGMPDAGKSSLLGALAQAAQTQERQLQGRLFDTTSGLAELQRRVYDDKPRETVQEIVPYPIRFEPFRGLKPDPTQRIDAVLFDCDGRIANEILTRVKSLDDPRAGQLADAVRRADALVLVVDAAASDEQIEADFTEFIRFLRLLEGHRTQRAEVGGLPVFLVLSKCDLLAQVGQAAAAWNQRIDERRSQLQQRFHEFLQGDDDTEEPSGFGSLVVDVATTAVRRPPFQGPAAAQEPFGVADLFRRAFLAARDYRQRIRRSHRRLMLVVTGAIAFLSLLFGAAVLLALTREAIQPLALSRVVDNYRSRENPTPSARLAGQLQGRISELTDIQRDPEFERLPNEQRAYVEDRLRELLAYQNYRAALERERSPAELHGPEELTRAEIRLQEALAPPAEFRDAWAQTEAELLRQKWLEDVRAIRRATSEQVDRYSGFTESGRELMQFRTRAGESMPWIEWHDRVRDLIRDASAPPIPETEPLRGSRALTALRAPAVTYATVYAFRTVEDARRDWDLIRHRLERARDLSLALGLAGDGSLVVSPLRLSEGFAVDQARERLEALRKSYPQSSDWSFAELPVTAATDVRLAAQSSYRHLIRAGQEVVLQEARRVFTTQRESHDGWKTIGRWLPDAAVLRDWGQLARSLLRLAGETPNDPAAVLSDFLLKPTHALRLRSIRVTIPDDAFETRLRPTGPLVVVHSGSGATRPLKFARVDDGEERDARSRATTFTFRLDSEEGLNYTPGDPFFAEMPVRDSSTPEREWKLTWVQCRSDIYRFECLHLLPKLHSPTSKASEGTDRRILLSLAPEFGIPRVPELMPVVILRP